MNFVVAAKISKAKSASDVTEGSVESNRRPFVSGRIALSQLRPVRYEFNADLIPLARFWDLEVKIGDEGVFRIHRVPLMRRTSYFHELLERRTEPCVKLALEKTIVDDSLFRMLVEWVYRGSIKIDIANFGHVRYLEKTFGVKGLDERCSKFMQDVCLRKGAMRVYEQACLLATRGNGLDELKEYALGCGAVDFVHLVKQSRFKSYSCGQLVALLSDDRLLAPNEKFVFEAAITWLTCDWRQRRHKVVQIMACIRFFEMNLEELYDCCRPRVSFVVRRPGVIENYMKALLFKQAYRRGEGESYGNAFGVPTTAPRRKVPLKAAPREPKPQTVRKSTKPIRKTKSAMF